VRDIERLRRVFTLVPDYLRRDAIETGINYMDYGVQLGRRFRALKAWIVWRTFGREGLAARIRDHLRLAKLFTTWIDNDDRFELAAPTVMGVVCFRLRNADDETHSALIEKINAGGKTYLMQTKLRGRVVMRLGLGNILTMEEHLREVWKIIRESL
jgi:aromatic-L-amino-acid decarboxylase